MGKQNRFKLAWAIVLLGLQCCMAAAQPTPPARPQCDPRHVRSPSAPPPPVLLYVDTTGVSLILPEHAAQKSGTTVAAVRAALLALPAEDWPQGCLVDVQQIGLPSENSDAIIARHMQEIERMLDELGIRIRMIFSL